MLAVSVPSGIHGLDGLPSCSAVNLHVVYRDHRSFTSSVFNLHLPQSYKRTCRACLRATFVEVDLAEDDDEERRVLLEVLEKEDDDDDDDDDDLVVEEEVGLGVEEDGVEDGFGEGDGDDDDGDFEERDGDGDEDFPGEGDGDSFWDGDGVGVGVSVAALLEDSAAEEDASALEDAGVLEEAGTLEVAAFKLVIVTVTVLVAVVTISDSNLAATDDEGVAVEDTTADDTLLVGVDTVLRSQFLHSESPAQLW